MRVSRTTRSGPPPAADAVAGIAEAVRIVLEAACGIGEAEAAELVRAYRPWGRREIERIGDVSRAEAHAFWRFVTAIEAEETNTPPAGGTDGD